MKKSLFALAVLGAFAGAAQAQSSVTLYGTADIGVYGGGNGQKTYIDGGGLWDSSVWGLKGTEDLGGGMKAMFQLEGGLELATGNGGAVNADGSRVTSINGGSGGLFNRESNVGISGAFGTIKAGNGLNPMVLENAIAMGPEFNVNFFVPMLVLTGNVGMGNGNTAGGFFDRNFVSYSLPATIPGFEATVFTTIDTSAGTTAATGLNSTVNDTVVRGSYSASGFRLGAAYENVNNNAYAAAWGGNVGRTGYTVDAGYTLDNLHVSAILNSVNWAAGSVWGGVNGQTFTSTTLGASYAVTPSVRVIANYATASSCILNQSSGSCSVEQLGVKYDLSKRTSLYAFISNNSNSQSLESFANGSSSPQNASAPNTTGYGFGLATHF